MIKHFERNNVGRDFVVGDVHGCFKLLQKRLDEIHFDPEYDRLFCTGDLVDRHDDSWEFYKWLDKPWFHSVCGNHEEMTLAAFDEGPMSQAASMHLLNGGGWFHGIPTIEQQCYVEVIRLLPLAIEVETQHGLVGILHADVPCGDWNLFKSLYWSNEDYFKAIAQWSRQRISGGWTEPVGGVHKVYVGHTVCERVVELGNVVYCDQGAVFTGNLTILQIN